MKKWNPQTKEIENMLTGLWIQTHEWQLCDNVWIELEISDPSQWMFCPNGRLQYEWPDDLLPHKTTYYVDYNIEVIFAEETTEHHRFAEEHTRLPERKFKILNLTEDTLEIALIARTVSKIRSRERYRKI